MIIDPWENITNEMLRGRGLIHREKIANEMLRGVGCLLQATHNICGRGCV